MIPMGQQTPCCLSSLPLRVAPQPDEKQAETLERKWLFHGTQEETVPKIISQGFNRSFAGLNATMYGKG